MKIEKLLQICDSSFPTGAFSHSFGLETYISNKKIKDKTTLQSFLHSYINILCKNELLAIRLLYETDDLNIKYLSKISQLLHVSFSASESKSANLLISKRFLTNLNENLDIKLLKEYEQECFDCANQAVSFAIFCLHENIELKTSIISFAFQTINTLTQNGVRAIPLSQKDAQNLLFSIDFEKTYQQCLREPKEHLGSTLIGLEISQMRHEELEFRLFMS